MGFFKNFLLLTAKNFMVMSRSICWTIFEFALPILFGALLTLVIIFTKIVDLETSLRPTYGESVQTVTYEQFKHERFFSRNFEPFLSRRPITHTPELNFICSSDSSVSKHDSLAFTEALASKFAPFPFEKAKSREAMMKTLEAQGKSEYLLYGIHFSKLNLKTASLSYELLIWNGAEKSNLGKTWDTPYQPMKFPATINNYTYIQQAIDSLFVEMSNDGQQIEPIRFRELPRAMQFYRIEMPYVYPVLAWLICVLIMPTIVYTSREISAEKESGMKDFLAVMGVSSRVFFFSHIFIGWLKGSLSITIGMGYLLFRHSRPPYQVNLFLLLLSLQLYVLAAVCFGAMIAALFGNPSTVLKMALIFQLVLLVIYGFPGTSPGLDKPGFSYIASLNFNAAFGNTFYAASDYVMRGRPLTFLTCFEDFRYFYNFGSGLLMLIVDIIWMTLVTFLADYIRSKTNFSLAMIFCFWRFRQEDEDSVEAETSEMASVDTQSVKTTVTTSGLLPDSHEPNPSTTPIDIKVENLVKVFSTGERAVNRMNLVAHRGQVSVLLGHNGAGKSTTFNVISGTIPATSGVVDVDSNIGLCPQGNSVFDKLTVAQHLWFFNKLKGGASSWRPEGLEMMRTLDMLSKSSARAWQLSGGQKRKLCLMIALIGNSRVVLLDEPTAGMDTGARADVKKMLEMAKKERTILLTTHYMDEAESLGDTITIMVRGKNVAGGSPQFLKKRFGTGYILTCVVESNEANLTKIADDVLKIATSFIPEAKLQKCQGKQLTIVVPTDQQAKFPDLFTALEGAKQGLGLESFGIALDTLEHVFLRVGELTEQDAEIASSSVPVYDASMDEKNSACGRLFFQLWALIFKRLLYAVRNWSQWLFQVVIPVAVAFLMVFALAGTMTGERTMNMKTLGSVKVLISKATPDQVDPVQRKMLKTLKKTGNILVEKLKGGLIESVVSEIQRMPMKRPTTVLALMFESDSVHAFINTNALHIISAYQNLYTNAQMEKGSITTVVRGYSGRFVLEGESLTDKTMKRMGTGVFVIFCFSFLTSAFCTFIVVERVSKFAHQQFLTGVPSVLYWTAAILYDIFVYTLTASLILVAIYVGNLHNGHMILMVLSVVILFFASMAFVYSASYIFSSPSKAYAMLIVWQLIISIVLLIITEVVGILVKIAIVMASVASGRLYAPRENPLKFMQDVLFIFFPVYALSDSINHVQNIALFADIPWAYWWTLIQMGICATLFLTLFVVSRFRMVQRGFGGCCKSRALVYQDSNMDPDVRGEQDYVLKNSGQFVLEVNNLTKTYKSMKKMPALSNLTFGVKAKECFGLLGTNGAGKTTTFGILTGEQFPSSGEARINGRSVKNSIVPLGYCPQFDAMLPDLTGRECLQFFASLLGYANPKGKTELILKAVLMEEHADKRYKNLSGGQKRKISVGVALLAQTTLTILDEPTAGIDPKARREIWSFLATVREHDNSALLLTSHSMDECEAMCTKIAILVKGQMVAVGTSQHLKTKYSNHYLLTLILPDPQKEGELKQRGEAAKKEVQTQFPGSVERTDFTNDRILKFMVPKGPNDKWSELWQKAKQVSETAACKDYSITQSTLTETFLELQRESKNVARKYV